MHRIMGLAIMPTTQNILLPRSVLIVSARGKRSGADRKRAWRFNQGKGGGLLSQRLRNGIIPKAGVSAEDAVLDVLRHGQKGTDADLLKHVDGEPRLIPSLEQSKQLAAAKADFVETLADKSAPTDEDKVRWMIIYKKTLGLWTDDECAKFARTHARKDNNEKDESN